MYISRDELFELIEAENPVNTWPSKWGNWHRYHVVRNGVDYIVDVDFHSTEGVQDEEFELQKAIKVTKTIETWEVEK